MTQRFFMTVTLLTAALLATAVPAFAQLAPGQMPGQLTPRRPGQQQRPDRGLFGGGVGDTSQRLILNASFGSGYDDDLAAPAVTLPIAPTGTPPRSGPFSVGSLNLGYQVDNSHVAGSLSLGTSARYYRGMTDPLVGTYNGGGNLSFNLGKRTSLVTSLNAGLFLQNMAIYPGYGVGNVPGVPVDPTAFANGNTYNSFRTGVEFKHNLTTRLALNAGYQYYANDAWKTAGTGRYGAQTASAGVSFSIAQGLGLRLGYSRSDAAFATTSTIPTYQGRAIDGGVTFDKSLSPSRRSNVSFGTGMSGFSDQNLTFHYFFTGHATFSYELGRSWTADAGYERTANMFQTFGQPVITDVAHTGVGGTIGRRYQVSGSVALVKGIVGVTSGSPGYTATSAGVGLQVALTRELAIGAGYSYYRYEFDNGVLLPPGMSSRMERQSVRVSLNVWVPLLTRARSTNAAR